MGIIQVRTPSGIKKVRIAGDTPTEAETQAIAQAFSKEMVPSDTADPTDEQIPSIPTREIDYDTGVQDTSFRYTFSKGDNEAEKRARLQFLGVPEEAIQIDQDGEFILDRDLLPEDVKTKYNIKGSGLLAIDERKGFTKNDWVDFAGEARGPLIGGITASLLASPLGFIPASLIAGGGSVAGYLFDEYQESEEGLRRETDEELGRGIRNEFLYGAIGEGGGRLLTSLLGRIFKGSGASTANEARALAREVIGEGARPTVRAVNESAILGRLQAIYEGVFPNQKAARKNADFVANELSEALKRGGVSGKAADKDKLVELINQDLVRIYGNPDEVVAQANNNLDNMVQSGLDDLIAKFGDETAALDSSQIARTIDVAKRIFDEDVDMMYGRAHELLDKKRIVPTESLVRKFEQLVKENPSFDLANSGVGKFILKFKGQGNTYKKATIQELTGIRTALRDAGFDPSLVGTQNNKFIGELLGTIEKSYRRAAIEARETMLRGRRADGTFVGKKDQQIIDGLDMLDKANVFYGKGIGRFRNTKASKIFRDYKDGNLDVEELFDPNGVLLAPNRGDTLNKFFKSVVPGGREGPVAPASFDEFLTRGGIDPKTINALPEDDYLRSTLTRKYNETKRFADEVAAARGAGVDVSNAVRNSMARNYLRRVSAQNRNVFGTPNISRLAEEIDKLGSTGEVLFGKQYKPLMQGLRDLAASGAQVTDRELASVAGMPIADQVAAIRNLTRTTNKNADNALLKGLSRAVSDGDPEKIVDLIFRKNSAAAIKQAEKELSPEAMDQVRQAAMERVLGQLPDQTTSAKEFADSVLAGEYSTHLNKILTTYGDDTIDAMFGEAGPLLRKLVKQSELVSNKPIKGLGALAPATIATSLSLTAVLASPLAAAGLATGLYTMSKGLRSATFLKLISRPTGVRPGRGEEVDQIGRALEIMYETGGQALAQQVGTGGTRTRAPIPVPTIQAPEEQQQRPISFSPTPTDVFSPISAQPPPNTGQQFLENIGNNRPVSPLLLGSNFATQQLAQALGRTK